jgi:hypothetical protein
MTRSVRLLACAPAALVLLAACGGGNAASQIANTPEFQPKDQSRCGVTRSQSRPLIVEWPSADRGELEAQVHKRGVVVVHYVGCEMQVLDRCLVPVQYTYAGITRKRDRVTMHDADELYANVPVGAAKLESQLARSGELNVQMVIVGRWEAERTSVRQDELTGDCDGATHLVSALSVGAFDFFAGADAEVGAGATVLGAGAGGKSASQKQMLNEDGDEKACDVASESDKEPPHSCGALLRVEVVPIGEPKKATPDCPDGSKWDGTQCVAKKVVTQVECPPGTQWDGSRCVARVSTACSSGLHFEAGRGCVPDAAAPPVQTAWTPPPSSVAFGTAGQRFQFGGWTIERMSSGDTYLWFGSGPSAAIELIKDSNGWWRLATPGNEWVMWSTGSREAQHFYEHPWQSAGTSIQAPDGGSFTLEGSFGSQTLVTRIEISGRNLAITVADGKKIQVRADSAHAVFNGVDVLAP